jgi:O-antigen ligase
MPILLLKISNRAAIYGLCVFPLLPAHLVSLLAIIFTITTGLQILLAKQLKTDFRFFWTISSIVLVYACWLFFSKNLAMGIQSVNVKLILVALPLCFSFQTIQLQPHELKRAFSIFVLSATSAVVITNMQILIGGFTTQEGDIAFQYRISLEQYSGLHPTYYCAIAYTAALLQLNHLLFDSLKSKWEYVTRIALFIICTTGGVAAASRTTFMAFILVSVFMVAQRFYNHRFKWQAALVVSVIAGSLFFLPTVQNRLLEMNRNNLKAPVGNNDNGTNVRSGIFACDIELLRKHWLLGTGTGNTQQALNNCLGNYQTHVYNQFNYNTHNEYLNAWLTCGILGFMIFVGCLIYGLYLAFLRKHRIHLYFLVFVSICFLTENYLDRQMGVTLFALMQSLFFHTTLKQHEIM